MPPGACRSPRPGAPRCGRAPAAIHAPAAGPRTAPDEAVAGRDDDGGLRAGSAYVNRNMIGAVVGVQPFGGEGLSGTGPKAGGPRYLHRFATERTLSIDTTAAGGNAALFSLDEEGAP